MCEVKLLPKSSKHHVQLKPVPTLITFYPCAFFFPKFRGTYLYGSRNNKESILGSPYFRKTTMPFCNYIFSSTLKPVNVLSASFS